MLTISGSYIWNTVFFRYFFEKSFVFHLPYLIIQILCTFVKNTALDLCATDLEWLYLGVLSNRKIKNSYSEYPGVYLYTPIFILITIY